MSKRNGSTIVPISRPLYAMLTREDIIKWCHLPKNRTKIVGYAGSCTDCPISNYIVSESGTIVHCVTTIRDIYTVTAHGTTERIKPPNWLAIVLANIDAVFGYLDPVKGCELSGVVKDITNVFPAHYYRWNGDEITRLVG